MSDRESERKLGYWFGGATLPHGDGRRVRKGGTLRVKPPLKMCVDWLDRVVQSNFAHLQGRLHSQRPALADPAPVPVR